MRGTAAVFAALAAALVACSAVAAGTVRDPRLERLELRPADTRAAAHASVRLGDLPAGWRLVGTKESPQEAPSCPGYRPDFSRFTITGVAERQYASGDGRQSIASRTEVYASAADARGDYDLATRPPVARCLGDLFVRATRAGVGSAVQVRLVGSTRVAAPRVGERAAGYRIVTDLSGPGGTVRVHVDVVVVQRGRSVAAVFFTGAGRPVAGRAPVVAAVARRLR